MDPITLAFYGIVCGCLGFAAPWLGSAPVRFGIGIATGLAATFVLPMVQNEAAALLAY